jgi:hypothetical protein
LPAQVPLIQLNDVNHDFIATVKNTGIEEATFPLRLLQDGQEIDSKNITLAAEAEEIIVFSPVLHVEKLTTNFTVEAVITDINPNNNSKSVEIHASNNIYATDTISDYSIYNEVIVDQGINTGAGQIYELKQPDRLFSFTTLFGESETEPDLQRGEIQFVIYKINLEHELYDPSIELYYIEEDDIIYEKKMSVPQKGLFTIDFPEPLYLEPGRYFFGFNQINEEEALLLSVEWHEPLGEWSGDEDANSIFLLEGLYNGKDDLDMLFAGRTNFRAVMIASFQVFVGLQDVKNNGILAYADNNSSRLQVAAEQPIRQIAVYDLKGCLVYKSNAINSTSCRISMDSWAKGLYMVRVSTADNSSTVKILVK